MNSELSKQKYKFLSEQCIINTRLACSLNRQIHISLKLEGFLMPLHIKYVMCKHDFFEKTPDFLSSFLNYLLKFIKPN